MQQLSYSDRSAILAIVERLKTASPIPDDLGLVGFLDDRYVLDTAMAMSQPQSDPWLRILDDTVERWPFLNRLILSANGTRHRLSEFLIANAALGLWDKRHPAARRNQRSDWSGVGISPLGTTCCFTVVLTPTPFE